MIFFILSFIAGVLTVLAPCTLPLLPVIVGSSVSGEASKKKAIIITASLGVSIIVFTLLLKVSTVFINIPQEVWSVVSGFIVIIFGIFTLAPEIWEDFSFVGRLSVSSNKLLGLGYKKNNFLGDMIIGISLGPVFSSCSPTYFVILASVLPKSFLIGLVDLAAYAVGLSGTLLLIAFLGQRLIGKVGSLSDTHGWFRRSLGAVFIIVGIGVVFGLDKKLQVSLLDSGLFDVTKIEQSLLKLNEKSEEKSGENILSATSSASVKSEGTREVDGETIKETKPRKPQGPQAPEITNPSGFINTDGKPITIAEFKGKKVILLDIWTYSCINCQRTLPYVTGWYEKYKGKGLVIIGLHTPEFAFERVKSNVEEAVKKFNITYPVVMDNEYATWTAYGNQYWPRKYLINAYGEIVYDHIGEGNYEETEKAIQKALSELNGSQFDRDMIEPSSVVSFSPGKIRSPEIYFGASRNKFLANGKPGLLGEQTLTLPKIYLGNLLYLEGVWNIREEYAETRSSGKIVFKYNARDVHIVASSKEGREIVIKKDGKLEKKVIIKSNELYTIIQGDSYGEHTLEVEIPEGVSFYTFTFG
jgi:cytochrome c biogenesis protein CcdA/thiol-disulfide isomerase/thioredoxin